jgi:hypothetical protein
MAQPSTTWSEVVGDDEQQRHADFAAVIVALQSRINARRGPGRAFHRKPVAALTGRLIVPSGLPEHAAQGLFAQPGEHAVVVRMSNGAMVAQADPVPDIRGFTFSVRGIEGPGALGTMTDRQDFLLINWPAFGFEDSRDFAAMVPAAAKGQKELAQHLVSRHGAVGGPMAMLKQAAAVARPFSGFATSDFHSCAPLAWGPYAAHVHVSAFSASRNLLAWRDWGADVRDRIARGPLRWHVQAQFYTDPKDTPIEDGRAPWRSAKETVAVLEADALADADEVEADHFDPWAALADHRPLGEIMRARKAAYWPSFQNRTP